jgi:pyrophosphatase PpaX
MKDLTCIIFDMDGTITQTNRLIFATFNHVAQKYAGKTYSDTEIIGMFGPPEEVPVEKLAGAARFPEAIAEFSAFYRRHHAEMAKLHDGMLEVLEYLKREEILVALFTGKGTRTTLITLEEFHLKEYFDLVVTGNDVEKHKPSADGIRKVMARFGLAPENVLMVGDAVSDIRAAREAGVRMAAVVWDSYAKQEILTMDVDCVFHTVAEFQLWLHQEIGTRPKGAATA